jgi:hypothetical protein
MPFVAEADSQLEKKGRALTAIESGLKSKNDVDVVNGLRLLAGVDSIAPSS